MTITPFDLAGYFIDDAKALVAAHAKATKVHANKDIDAAGDEVEIPAREILRARLSRRYHVGHGHIVDSRLMTSRQLDVIVADEANTPVLFKAKNETEFMPYESVYAIGEVKSKYYKSKKPIEAFSGVLGEIETGLARQPIIFSMGSNGVTNVIRQNPLGLNPLFSFMLFVNGDEFEFTDVEDFFNQTPSKALPSAVCLLNKGVIIRASVSRKVGGLEMGNIIVNPTSTGDSMPPEEHRWIFIRANHTDPDHNIGFTLALLCFMLFGSLSSSAVLPPNMSAYIGKSLATFQTSMECSNATISWPTPVKLSGASFTGS